jgi:hypothetical protein
MGHSPKGVKAVRRKKEGGEVGVLAITFRANRAFVYFPDKIAV